jgi:membrane protein YdbS with pleckstrin-like domain
MIKTLFNSWKHRLSDRRLLERIKNLLIDSIIRTGLTVFVLAVGGGFGLYFFPYPYILVIVIMVAVIYSILLMIGIIHTFERERLEFRLHEIELTLDHIYNLSGTAHLDELARSLDELTFRVAAQ